VVIEVLVVVSVVVCTGGSISMSGSIIGSISGSIPRCRAVSQKSRNKCDVGKHDKIHVWNRKLDNLMYMGVHSAVDTPLLPKNRETKQLEKNGPA
jgi:hypothetical protein